MFVDQAGTDLDALLRLTLSTLGYGKGAGYVQAGDPWPAGLQVGMARTAFVTIGVDGILCLRDRPGGGVHRVVPMVYVAVAADEVQAHRIHVQTWSQGVVPILLVVTLEGLQVRRGFQSPTMGGSVTTVRWGDLREGDGPARALSTMTPASLGTSAGWRDFAQARAGRIDGHLLDGIRVLSQVLQERYPALAGRPSLINRVVGRFIYLYTLVDRGLVTQGWVDGLNARGRPACPSVRVGEAPDGPGPTDDAAWGAGETWALFDAIDGVMNGSVFHVDAADRDLLEADALHLVRRMIRHGDVVTVAGRQTRMFEVSFATLRVETISAIYELFLTLNSPDAKVRDGAFYTPPFLVDFMLDELEARLPMTRDSRIIDPAAGSGAFLIAALRRLLDREAPAGGWGPASLGAMRRLVVRTIHGMERDPQAAEVARFGICLTIFDHLGPCTMGELAAAAGQGKVFPTLDRNILVRDAFSAGRPAGKFTHVLCNPPWGRLRTEDGIDAPAETFRGTLDAGERPVAGGRLSELFAWRIERDLLAPDGALALLVSTRSFVGLAADDFPRRFSEKLALTGIVNLSQLRYRLFDGARSPALAVFARGRPPVPDDETQVYVPRPETLPLARKGAVWALTPADDDVSRHRQASLFSDARTLADALLLRPVDAFYARFLRDRATRGNLALADFLERSRLEMLKGDSPRNTGLPAGARLDTTTYRVDLGLTGEVASYVLPHASVEALEPRYARRFTGGRILVPRSMKEFDYVDVPAAFSSSFNVIVPKDEVAPAGLRALAAYLGGDVFRYLVVLFGTTFAMDGRRMERSDLLAMPIPFEDLSDPRLLALVDGSLEPRPKGRDVDAATDHVARCLGLDGRFGRVVAEYARYRRHARDGKMPRTAPFEPRRFQVSSYGEELRGELDRRFAGRADVRVEAGDVPLRGRTRTVVVTLGKAGEGPATASARPDARPPARAGTASFGGTSVVSFDEASSTFRVIKASTRAAWTVERAYSDARNILLALGRA